MSRNGNKRGVSRPLILTLIAIGILALLCLIFPGVLAFVETASRELRYFWWLVLMVAVGIYLIFFLGKNRKN